jgi:phosphonate dehydrogenase
MDDSWMKQDRPLIVVTNQAHPDALAVLAGFARIDANPSEAPWPRAELLRRAASANGLLAFMTDHVDGEFLAHCPELRAIGCALKGADNFDLAACRAHNVAVAVVPDLLTAPTAELALGLMIGLGRHIRAGDALVRAGGFAGWRPILFGAGLEGAVVGIIGMGAVGRGIAARLAGFACQNIIHHDPAVPGSIGLAELLATADWVVLAAPLNPGTLHMIDRAALARMQPGALLVNIARGSLVDEAAVAEALQAGHLAGYAADAFELEDWARADRPASIPAALLEHPRSLFTPHLGSAVVEVRRQIAVQAARALAEFFASRPMPGRL